LRLVGGPLAGLATVVRAGRKLSAPGAALPGLLRLGGNMLRGAVQGGPDDRLLAGRRPHRLARGAGGVPRWPAPPSGGPGAAHPYHVAAADRAGRVRRGEDRRSAVDAWRGDFRLPGGLEIPPPGLAGHTSANVLTPDELRRWW